MNVAIAFYKGPPPDADLTHLVSHALTSWWTDGPYSHCELVVGGTCYSASARDRGVRAKQIDLNSGRWDVLNLPHADQAKVLAWFALHAGERYDWANIGRFVVPLLPHVADQWVCSEACAAALGLPAPHRFSPNSLHRFIAGTYALLPPTVITPRLL